MTEHAAQRRGFLHWCRQHWLGALIGLAISAFVFDLIGPEKLAKPFLCGRDEIGLHIYSAIPESSFKADWRDRYRERYKNPAVKSCEPQPGWDECIFVGPDDHAMLHYRRSFVFWSVVKHQEKMTTQAGVIVSTNLFYSYKQTIGAEILQWEGTGGALCNDASKIAGLGSDISIDYRVPIQLGK